MNSFLSVMIPCRNEVRFLRRCLDSILANDFPAERMEVLVIDGGSTDGTRELIEEYCHRDTRVRLVENPESITPWALNHGIDEARGDVIARVDAHSSLAVDYFSQCVSHLLSSEADNVGGVMRTVAQDRGAFAKPIVTVLSHPFGVGNSYFRTGSTRPRWVETVFGGCWKREVFERIGRFNPALRRSQDMEFSLRLKAGGGKTLLVPEIHCDYYARTRFSEFCLHNYRNGEWAVLPWVYSDIIPVSARHLIPLCFVLGLLAGSLACLWTPWLLLGIAIPYLIANLTATLHAVANIRDDAPLGLPWQDRVRYPILLAFAFFALHSTYGLGSVAGCVKAGAVLLNRTRSSQKEDSCLPQC